VRKLTRNTVATVAVLSVATLAAACGSSSSSSGGGGGSASAGGSSGSSGSSPVSTPTTGAGLTQPYAPAGTRIQGGTVYFTQIPEQMPNYIFPMYSPQVCGTQNINQLMYMMFRPLYWFGNNYRPTIDYDYSIGQQPQFSGGGQTVTIKLNAWKWADGEAVTSRDLEFWMNLMKADPATEWCGYVPGYFPDNVTSYSAPNPQTFVLHFKKAYNPVWVTYDELSQLTPIPLAWDRTSLSQPAPTSDNGHLPDTTKAGALAVYKFLDGQSKDLGTWDTSPLWKVVDGPFRLDNFTSNGQVTFVPNPNYSGSPKPSISKLVTLPFTSEAAVYNEVRSSGPTALTIASLPQQYAPQVSTLTAEGYSYNKAASYSFNYFPLNFHNPKVGPIFSQLYFRQAFQHLIDQQGWIDAFLSHTANATYGPVPPSPPSPLVSASLLTTNPYPFSVSAASSLLSSHGWKVVPNGTTTCQNPTLCGQGITKGEGISFNIDYASGVVATEDEMNDLQAQARKVGINIDLTTHPFATVIGTAVACEPTQPTCKWQAENWGAGWIYGPSYLPTGEQLFAPGAVANYGSFSDPSTTGLIQAVTTASDATQALNAYAENVEHMVPVVFGPTSIGTYAGDAGVLVAKTLGGYAANALGQMNPEDWYFTR
jgi:peptide/nickel transport system substrate-binding protein